METYKLKLTYSRFEFFLKRAVKTSGFNVITKAVVRKEGTIERNQMQQLREFMLSLVWM